VLKNSRTKGKTVTEAERTRRQTLARLLYEAGIFGLTDEDIEEEFISGNINPKLTDIGIDSLSEMELCIGIENEFGVSIAPTELHNLATLDDLLDRI